MKTIGPRDYAWTSFFIGYKLTDSSGKTIACAGCHAEMLTDTMRELNAMTARCRRLEDELATAEGRSR